MRVIRDVIKRFCITLINNTEKIKNPFYSFHHPSEEICFYLICGLSQGRIDIPTTQKKILVILIDNQIDYFILFIFAD